MSPTSVPQASVVLVLCTALFLACSGSSATPITGGSTSDAGSTGTPSDGGGTRSGGPDPCPPCVPGPPNATCRGTGPCGCAPYDCSPDGGVKGCEWQSPETCAPGTYCNAENCGRGTCIPVGTEEAKPRNPQCGCDGVTYWNPSVAAKNAMSIRKDGVCSGGGDNGAKTCGGAVARKCPGRAVCNQVVKDKQDCGVFGTGICWILPAACPATETNGRACGNGGGGGACQDACALVRSERPWFDDPSCLD